MRWPWPPRELPTVGRVRGNRRGSRGLRREWISSPRLGIYLSILLRTPLPVQEAFQATYILALSLVKVLRGKYGLPGAIKWPNDILIGPRKVGGILTEMQSDQDFTRFLVIGIGINVNHTKEDLAGPFRYPATSLAIERGEPVARRELLITSSNASNPIMTPSTAGDSRPSWPISSSFQAYWENTSRLSVERRKKGVRP